jgi:glutaminyl-tRNA synthetase
MSDNKPASEAAGAEAPSNFIRSIVEDDLKEKRYTTVATRFPPEPNGYLHIGHAKSICLNFGLAKELGGTCRLRFDDTNPAKEDMEYVEAIQRDVKWLGFDWEDRLYHAADYFDRLYDYAVELIKQKKAYVCSLSEEETRKMRGTVTEAGKPSPHRNRSVEENLDLLNRMRNREFPEGAHTVRLAIDMANPNMKMRDPPIYRIRHVEHHRTGNKWCIYPLYDFAQCLSDHIEGVTHSICTLEFENNRELYDWILTALDIHPPRPKQIEFAKLKLSYTMMSKRRLIMLVEEGVVNGWDDPRMATLAGFRRRGYTPEAIREFCERIGVARRDGLVDFALLEWAIRDDLNTKVGRVMGVLKPLKLVIENYPEGQSEDFDAANFPDDPPKMGMRKVPFGRELYIERDDFMENPPKKFFRLSPGNEVRLRWAYIVRCTRVIKDASGEITEVHCTYDPNSRGGTPADGRKIKGTIHWVSAEHAFDAEVRLYEQLFTYEEPGAEPEGMDWRSNLNPTSLQVLRAKLERSLLSAQAGDRYQFERQGFFYADPIDSKPGAPVFNRIVALRDGWAKIAKSGG